MSKIILVISIILSLSYLLVILYESKFSKRVHDLRISKKKFVTMVLHWCYNNIGSINDPYYLKIHYYKHLKFQGTYDPVDKLIEIYIYDELELRDLISTLIHEYFHHLQSIRESVMSRMDSGGNKT